MQSIQAAISAHIDSHQTEGTDWPTSALFCAVSRTSTWPIGWSAHRFTEFFESMADLEAWKIKQHEWAKYEDNYIAYRIYEWDLGPTIRFDLSYNEFNV